MQLLISVAGPAEARAALRGGADVIDAKDPRRGALGPVPPHRLAAPRAGGAGAPPVRGPLGGGARGGPAGAGGAPRGAVGFARGQGADLVGVRGAACVGGRTGRVSRTRVAALRALTGAAAPPPPPACVPVGRGLLSQRDVELSEIVRRDDEMLHAVRERA